MGHTIKIPDDMSGMLSMSGHVPCLSKRPGSLGVNTHTLWVRHVGWQQQQSPPSPGSKKKMKMSWTTRTHAAMQEEGFVLPEYTIVLMIACTTGGTGTFISAGHGVFEASHKAFVRLVGAQKE